MNSQINTFNLPYTLKNHDFFDLVVNSEALKGNPLADPIARHNYVLVPKKTKDNLPLIFHLSGYFSTGYSQFQAKTLNENFVQKLDRLLGQKKIPQAIHVFVEATTYWGGSQFINSAGCGRYSDYILKDLYSAVKQHFPITSKASRQVVMGGSSGGYGALALISQKDSPFGVAFATAPDSYFEASLLPEIFHAAPELLKYKNFKQLRKQISIGEIQDKKSFFTLANVVAMAHCYSPQRAFKNDFIEFPIDLYSGELNKTLWKDWLKNDPVHFLKARKKNLTGKTIHLDVGKYDNFCLQFGTRQVAQVLKDSKVKHTYTEFPGNHFGLSSRRIDFLQQLSDLWRLHV